MLVRYDLCRRSVVLGKFRLREANGGSTPALIERVMETRPGLDRKKVARLVAALWKAEN